MAIVRHTRLTILVALLLATAVLAYIAAHPRIYASHVGRLVTRNLLRDTGISFSCQDLAGNPLKEMRFARVSLTRRGDDGSFAYLTCDSLSVAYDVGALVRRDLRLSRVAVIGGQLVLRRGEPREGRALRRDRARPSSWDVPLRVADAELRDLSILVTAPDGEPEEEIEELRWRGSARGEEGGLLVQVDGLAARWLSRGIQVHEASATLRLRPGELEVEEGRAVLDSTSARLRGRLELPEGGGVGDLSLEAEAERFHLGELLRILGKDPGPRLILRAAATIEKDSLGVHIDGHDVRGHIEQFPVSAERVRCSVVDHGITFHGMRGTFLEAGCELGGRLEFEGARLHLNGRARGADLQQPWTGQRLDWPESALDADFDLRLRLEEPLDLQLELSEGRGEVAGFPLEALHTLLRYRRDGDVIVEEGEAIVRDTRLNASGRVDPEGLLEMLVHVEADSLSRWCEWLGWPLAGWGLQAVGRLHGSPEAPSLRLGGHLDRAEGYGFEAEDNQIVLELPVWNDFERLRAQVVATELRARGRLVGSLRTELDRDGSRTRFHELTLALGDSVLSGQGTLSEGDSTAHLRLDALDFLAGEELWSLAEPSELTVGPGVFRTPGMEVASDTGRFRVEGGLSLDGPVDLRVTVVDGDLSLLTRTGLFGTELSGLADGSLALEGTLRRPSGQLQLFVSEGAVAGRPVESLGATLEVEEARVGLQSLRLRSPDGELELSGDLRLPRGDWLREAVGRRVSWPALWAGTGLDVEATLRQLDPVPWMEPGAEGGRFGRSDARLRLLGTARSPRVEGQLSIDRFVAGPLTLPRVEAQVQADSLGVRLEEGVLLVPDPWLRGRARLPLRISAASRPRWEPERGVEIEIDSGGEIDLRPLSRLTPLLPRTEGRGRIVYRATGDPAAPQLEGVVRVRDGILQVDRFSEEFREVEIQASFDDAGVLVIHQISGREGENGRIDGTGTVRFRGLLPDDVSVDARAHRVLVLTVPYLRAIATSDDLQLRLVRPLPEASRVPRITGTLLVDKAIYTGSFGNEAGAEPAAVLEATAAPDWLAELKIRAQDQVRISNQNLELRIQGDMDFIRDLDGLRLRGEVEIPQGRVPLFNNDFTITDGRLDFSRGPGLVPVIDITAETEVPVYDPAGGAGRELERITVHLTGEITAPMISFESESGFDQNHILRLLAGFSTEEGEFGAGIGSVGFRAGLNYLERALSQQIGGVDTIDIETEEAGLEEMGNTRIAVGKYLSNNLYLRFSQGLSITERDLFLEYQITRWMLFTSELRRRLRENATQTQFNLDLKFRVEY